MLCFATKRARYITLSVSVIICLFIISRPSVLRHIFGACACGQCVLDLTHDTWFQQHYDPYTQPLLTKKNSKLSNALYWWWQKLQYKSRVNYKAIAEMLFGIFPNEEDYSDAGPGRCRTCAVVGNSGNLKGSHYGALIDAHDLVVRHHYITEYYPTAQDLKGGKVESLSKMDPCENHILSVLASLFPLQEK